MRWLLIVLFVSLAGLLIAAAGMTIHIWVQRARLRSRPRKGAGPASDTAEDAGQETDV
jgi:hypothetical protein